MRMDQQMNAQKKKFFFEIPHEKKNKTKKKRGECVLLFSIASIFFFSYNRK